MLLNLTFTFKLKTIKGATTSYLGIPIDISLHQDGDRNLT